MEYKRLKDIDFASSINRRVFAIFMARDVDVRKQKDGVTDYLNLNMCDKDIKIEARKFGATESDIRDMINGGIYCAAIDVKEYKGAYSCILYNFEKVDKDPSEFVDWADGMDWANRIIQSSLNVISESIYKDIVYRVLYNNWGNFTVWSAASSFHHNTLGGLMVHTAEVVSQCEQLADFWESRYGPCFINKPLLFSAAVLHDIGKTKELNVDRLSGNTEYSTQASLETHITMCVSMIDVEAYKLQLGYQTYRINEVNEKEAVKSNEQLKFEQEAVSLLKHCILAHHGKKEYGSPIETNCPEAYLLHIADNLSSEMFRYNKNFGQMSSGESVCAWLGGNMVCTYKDSTK